MLFPNSTLLLSDRLLRRSGASNISQIANYTFLVDDVFVVGFLWRWIDRFFGFAEAEYDKTLIFWGTVSSINAALKKLTYKNGAHSARIETTIVDKVAINFPQTKDSISDPAASVVPSEANSVQVALGCAE